MKWKHPPIIKIYEALGTIADGRVEVTANTAKVYSSSRNKFYDVTYDPERSAIMANDNGSYWTGKLGYPAIAYLLKVGVLPYESDLAQLLKDVAWKDVNQKFKNNFDKSLEHILSKVDQNKTEELESYARSLEKGIEKLNLSLLGKRALPPSGY